MRCVAGSGGLVLKIGGRLEIGLRNRWEVGFVGGGLSKQTDRTEVETHATHPSGVFVGLHHAMHD